MTSFTRATVEDFDVAGLTMTLSAALSGGRTHARPRRRRPTLRRLLCVRVCVHAVEFFFQTAVYVCVWGGGLASSPSLTGLWLQVCLFVSISDLSFFTLFLSYLLSIFLSASVCLPVCLFLFLSAFLFPFPLLLPSSFPSSIPSPCPSLPPSFLSHFPFPPLLHPLFVPSRHSPAALPLTTNDKRLTPYDKRQTTDT